MTTQCDTRKVTPQRGGLAWLSSTKRSDRALFTAGSCLFVVLGRVRMKRERSDAGDALGIPWCDPKETYGGASSYEGVMRKQ